MSALALTALIVHALHVCATLCSESWATFRYVTEQTNWAWGVRELARASGAVLMWQVGKKMPAKYGIEGDLREALYKCVLTLSRCWIDCSWGAHVSLSNNAACLRICGGM